MRYTKIVFLLLTGFHSVSAQNVDKELSKLQLAWQLISTFYVDSVNKHELTENAIRAMLNGLDPHSVYIPAEEVQTMNEPLDGNFEGVGIEFMILHDTLVVVSTISGGPSERVGLMPGDRIVKVDGKNMASTGITNKDVFDALRGPRGSEVQLSVLRGSNQGLLQFIIQRDKIPIYSIEAAYMASQQTGYIKISRFAQNTHSEFKQALKALKEQGMSRLVLDLSGNGGGYLKAALDIADEFIGNRKLLLYTKGVAVPRSEFKAGKGGLWEELPLVVLIDEGSASASEIVAGAVQDWDRGLILGRRSFGKGLVQRPLSLPDGSEIRLTIAQYYTPTGRCIQKPYEKGKDDYRSEIYQRYLNGEMMHRDSIHLADTLNFKTLVKQRPVFGGGGIMPDVFVPLDTFGYSDYYRNLAASGIINRFVMDLMDANREKWQQKYDSFDEYSNDFSVTPSLIEQLAAEGETAGIARDTAQLNISHNLIATRLKALIARNLWSTTEFFQVINPHLPIYQKAICIIEGQGAP